jgi:hypothetical protein
MADISFSLFQPDADWMWAAPIVSHDAERLTVSACLVDEAIQRPNNTDTAMSCSPVDTGRKVTCGDLATVFRYVTKQEHFRS